MFRRVVDTVFAVTGHCNEKNFHVMESLYSNEAGGRFDMLY